MRPSIPTEIGELNKLAQQCSDVLMFRVEPLLKQLKSLQRDPGSFTPGRLCEINAGGGIHYFATITQGIDPRRDLNQDIEIAASDVRELIKYFDLSCTEQEDLHVTADKLVADKSGKNVECWQVKGLWVSEIDSEQRQNPEEANAVLLTALLSFFEGALLGLISLRQHITRKLFPPQVRDRVQVDLVRCTVTVDGLQYAVTANQAILFHHLAQANGEGLSGTEIGHRANFGGAFRAGRYRDQIKAPKLKKLIPNSATSPDRKFRLVLPPLAE